MSLYSLNGFVVSSFVSEIFVGMHDWLLTPYELLSMVGGKWVVSVVISTVARMLSDVNDHVTSLIPPSG